MIFISHNRKDKPIVEPIALKLAEVFDQDKDIPLNTGMKANFITVGISRGTLPGFPFIVELSSDELSSFDVISVLHQVSSDDFAPIPMINGRP